MAISFKSVGDLATDRKFKSVINEIPIGIKTPLSLGTDADGIFSMHYTLANQIQDNLRNLIQTNWGERLAFYNFGANLNELTMELSSDEFNDEAMKRIKHAVSKWMPFVELEFFDKQVIGRTQGSNVTQVKIRLIYNVPTLNVKNKGLELTFFFAG